MGYSRRYYRKKRYHRDDDDLTEKSLAGILLIYGFSLIVFWYTDRAKFWTWVGYGAIVVVTVIAFVIAWKKARSAIRIKREQRIQEQITSMALEEDITNFINRFGLGKEAGPQGFYYRGYSFEEHRLTDFYDLLIQHGLKISHREFFALVRRSIDDKERKLTLAGIGAASQTFAALTGPDFERLLYRLFEKMGYAVQLTGKVGDQGGDLVITKDGMRTLVQAKCWKWPVGNRAVQEAIAARSYWDCAKAMVVATNDFTPEAIDLAKKGETELIPKRRLQELLSQHLNESWT